MNEKKLKTKLLTLESSIEFSEVLSFVKGEVCYMYSKKYSKPYLFWQSNLPIRWFENFLNEPFFEEFLFGYFSHEENSNPDFLELLANSRKKATLIKVIKLSEAFNKPKHWNSFRIFSNSSDTQLKLFYRELTYVVEYRKYWKNKSLEYADFVRQLDYEDILIQIISYFEKFKRYSNQTIDNNKILISNRAILISILNKFLNIKKEFIVKNKLNNTAKYDTKTFQIITKKQLPPVKPVEAFVNPNLIPKENIDELKEKFRNTIEFFFAMENNEYQIRKYLTGFADFEMIDGLEAELKTNEKHILYRKTLERNKYDEAYLSNRIKENSQILNKIKDYSIWEKEFKLKKASSLEYFRFLKIPTTIKDKYIKTDIDIEKALFLYQTFSALLMPQGRMVSFVEDEAIVDKRKIPENFEKIFYSDYVVSYSEQELIAKCEEYFKWSADEIKAIIDFLTTDLSTNRKFEIDISRRPIIKIGEQYIWLSSFLRDTRWEILLHRRIASYNLGNSEKQSAEAEKFISELFREAGFGAVASHCYQYDNQKGEIDVLAFKDNTLFVLELKSTYVEEDIMKTYKYETLKFNSKASEQLLKAKNYISNVFSEIQNIEELNINCKKEDIKIVTIIVSNIYQADHLVFNQEHLKISLFELLIILKNDLYNMLVDKSGQLFFGEKFNITINSIEQFYNRNAPTIKKENPQIYKKDCNLWEDKNNCKPSDIISAIKEDKIWKHQNLIVETENIELKEFDKDYRYLN